jgi:hypothetical protein
VAVGRVRQEVFAQDALALELVVRGVGRIEGLNRLKDEVTITDGDRVEGSDTKPVKAGALQGGAHCCGAWIERSSYKSLLPLCR